MMKTLEYGWHKVKRQTKDDLDEFVDKKFWNEILKIRNKELEPKS